MHKCKRQIREARDHIYDYRYWLVQSIFTRWNYKRCVVTLSYEEGLKMYVITGSNSNHWFRIRVTNMKRAISIADQKAEEGYDDIKIETYTEQLALQLEGDKKTKTK